MAVLLHRASGEGMVANNASNSEMITLW